MTLVDDLKAAKALIDTPEKWGKGRRSYAGPAAPALCIIGACYRDTSYATHKATTEALEAVLFGDWSDGDGYDDGLRLARFNDAPTTTHNDVLALFDRAIKRAEQSA